MKYRLLLDIVCFYVVERVREFLFIVSLTYLQKEHTKLTISGILYKCIALYPFHKKYQSVWLFPKDHQIERIHPSPPNTEFNNCMVLYTS